MLPRLLTLFILPAALLSACGPEGDDGDATPLDYAPPELDPGQGVATTDLPQVELEQSLQIRESEELLFGIVIELLVDSRGHILAPDIGQQQVFPFSPEGDPLEPIGGPGSGPGEIEMLARGNTLLGPDDAVYVYDPPNARVTRFASDGAGGWQMERITPFDESADGNPVLIREDDSYIVSRDIPPEDRQEGLFQEEHKLMHVGPEGELLEDSLLIYNRASYINVRDGRQLVTGHGAFTRSALLDHGSGGRLYMMWNESADIRVFDEGGNPIDTLSVPVPNQPVTREEFRWALNHPNYMSEREHIPDTKPVATELFAGPDGRIWLETHDSPQYLIAGAQGQPLGAFDLPEGHELAAVDDEYLYTIGRDEEDWRLLRAYRYRLPE